MENKEDKTISTEEPIPYIAEIQRLRLELEAIKASRTYRLWQLYAGVKYKITNIFRLANISRKTSENKSHKALDYTQSPYEVPDYRIEYKIWLDVPKNYTLPNHSASPEATPISIVIKPIGNQTEIKRSLQSISSQTVRPKSIYLCLLSQEDLTVADLDKYSEQMQIITCTAVTPAQAINEAIYKCDAEWVLFMNQGDTLEKLAIELFARAIATFPNCPIFYADEDFLIEPNVGSVPFFKPDWSPYLLQSINYIDSPLCVRKDLLEEVGGLDNNVFEQSLYDLVLRLTEKVDYALHIPLILYHNFQSPNSLYNDMETKIKTVKLRLSRQNQVADVEIHPHGRTINVIYKCPQNPKISIIIPAGGNTTMLERCLDSIFARTTYTNYEVLLIDNSPSGNLQVTCANYPDRPIHYLRDETKPFNFAKLINTGAKYVSGDIFVFLNDDTQIQTSNWLELMSAYAQRSDVGVVGALLLYPDSRIQHAGVVLGIGGNCGHAFKWMPVQKLGELYYGLAACVREYSAITFACAMVERQKFYAANGLDEQKFAVAFNDVDFCIKLARMGYKNIYLPFVIIYHHESASKEIRVNPVEVQNAVETWADLIEHDPYYSPHLTRSAENFGLRLEPYSFEIFHN
jgi:GT2 family glycosyltransferase